MSAAAMKDRFADADVIAPGGRVWTAPDLNTLSAGRSAAPTMPRDMFGNVAPLLDDLARGAGAPFDYVALAFLSVAASLIGAKRRAVPFDTSSWSEPAILWVGLVGDPSANKSPAMDVVTEPLRAMEKDGAELHKQARMRWEEENERAKFERATWQEKVKEAAKEGLETPAMPPTANCPAEPERRRLMVQDITPEALASILSSNPSGTLYHRDELSGWLTTFDRYSTGGRPFWLEAYGGRFLAVDRAGKKDGPIVVDFMGASILGGIQPQKLAEALFDAPDDGLAARIMWAWPQPIPYTRPERLAETAKLETLYRRLDGLDWGIGDEGGIRPINLRLDAGAADIFEDWIRENNEGLEDRSAIYQGFVGKMKGAVLRLALVAELVAWAWAGGNEPKSISATTLGCALDFVDAYVKPTARRVFGEAALPPVERNAALLLRYLRKQEMRSFNARLLKRSPHKANLPGLGDAASMNDALGLLVDGGWLMSDGHREGGSTGRGTSDYIVNPALFGGDCG